MGLLSSAAANGNIVTASDDGRWLARYRHSDAERITVGGKIDKFASNIG
jgi:hypothetical protein